MAETADIQEEQQVDNGEPLPSSASEYLRDRYPDLLREIQDREAKQAIARGDAMAPDFGQAPAPVVERPQFRVPAPPTLESEKPVWSTSWDPSTGTRYMEVNTPAMSPYGPTQQAQSLPLLREIYQKGGFALGEQVRAASQRMEGKYGWDADTRALVNQGMDESEARLKTLPRWADKLIPVKDARFLPDMMKKLQPAPLPRFTPADAATGAPGYFSGGRVQPVTAPAVPPTSVQGIPVLDTDGKPIPGKVAIPGRGGGVHIENIKPEAAGASVAQRGQYYKDAIKDIDKRLEGGIGAETPQGKALLQERDDLVRKRRTLMGEVALPRPGYAEPDNQFVEPPTTLPLTNAAVKATIAPPVIAPVADVFDSEEQARANGRGKGDVIRIKGVGKVRLK